MRFAKFDNFKCFLIFSVVIGHMLSQYSPHEYPLFNGLYIFIYLFHMPSFLFVSGLFAKKTIDNYSIWKITPYLVVYLVLIFALRMTTSINSGYFVQKDLLTTGGLPWFMLSMFILPIITMGLKRFKPAYVLTVSIFLALVSGYSTEPPNFLAWLRNVNFFPFFYLGYLLDFKKLGGVLHQTYIRVISLICILITFSTCMIFQRELTPIRALLTGNYPYKALGTYAKYGPVLRLSLYAIIFILILMFISVASNKESIITTIGRRTLGIYCTHHIFIKTIYNLGYADFVVKHFPQYWETVVLLTGCFVFIICSNKYFDQIVRKIFDDKWKLRQNY